MSKMIRIYHKKDDKLCHAWDVDLTAYRMWKTSGARLLAKDIRLPNGSPPERGALIECGTCDTKDFGPADFVEEVLSGKVPKD